MNTFINYALQANLALLFFLLMESIFFTSEKSFNVRRFFLLGGIVVSLSIPLLKNVISSLPLDDLRFSITLEPITVVGSAVENESLSAGKIFEYLYFMGVAIFLFHLLKQFVQLFKVFGKPYKRWQELRVYENAEPHYIFSFFRFVSVSTEQFSSWERNKILRHELVHAQRLHSIDILLISLVQIIFWFNPLLYFYKRKLIQLHEFEADARSVQSEEVDLYCSLLAKVALQSSGFTLANHFTQPFTLNRITMMKSMNKKLQLWKIAMMSICTILFLGAMCFYQPAVAQDDKSQDKVFTFVDEVPEYPGGSDGLIKYFVKELKYPESARKNRTMGTSIIQFVVEKDGSITNTLIKKGFNKECDDEALRVVQTMKTKWIPGKQSGKPVRTQMVIPVQFKLS
jgi:TonB family protein